MATKAEFLGGLTATAIESTPMPQMVESEIKAPLPDLFHEVLGKVGGKSGEGSSMAAVQDAADQLVADGNQVMSLVAGVTGNRDPATVDDPYTLSDLDYLIAPARLAVAENAAVWVTGEDLIARVAPFICENLIAVTHTDTLLPTMSDAIRAIGKFGGKWGAFISGPSKTADIEQSLVMGAHGARTMTVFLVEDTVTPAPGASD